MTLNLRVLSLFKNGNTALHIAAENNRKQIVPYLLKRDCDPHITNTGVSTGETFFFLLKRYMIVGLGF